MGNIQYQIGLGEKILLWHDNWAVDHLLATQFPDLFNCVVDKDAKVQDYLQIIGEQKVWSPILRRNLKEHEEDQLISLLNLLIEVYIVDGGEDERRWNASKNGSLSVSSFLAAISRRGITKSFVVSLWKIKAPRRVVIFGWLALWKSIITMDNLRRRGRIVVNPPCA